MSHCGARNTLLCLWGSLSASVRGGGGIRALVILLLISILIVTSLKRLKGYLTLKGKSYLATEGVEQSVTSSGPSQVAYHVT